MKKITKNVSIRFVGNKEVVDFAILCLRGDLQTNINWRRFENNNNINIIEAEITSIK